MQKKTNESFTELKGGDRLYNLFKKKMEKNPTANIIQRRKFKNPLGQQDKDEEKDLCITIPLKGAKGGKSGQLDKAFLQSIQEEYATRYLEFMRIEPNQRNKAKVLKKSPLTSCYIKTNWSNSGWLADTISLYPNRTKTEQTYENGRDQIVETKQKNERLIREAENQKVEVWKLEDEESDEEVACKMRELLGMDARQQKEKVVGRSQNVNQITQQMEIGAKNLKKSQLARNKVNSMIEEKKQSLAEVDEDQNCDDDANEGEAKPQKRFELNLDPDYWRKKFLYPFALDPAPLRLDASKQSPEEMIAEKKRQKLLGDESILSTTKYQFPYNQFKKMEFFYEIQKPINFTMQDIMKDMHLYEQNFNRKIIPHIGENNQIVDNIHNYGNGKTEKSDQNDNGLTNESSASKKKNLALEKAPQLHEKSITDILQQEIANERTARLIGLVAHLAYWSVFGQFNKLPLDMYHRKQLFISIAKIQAELEAEHSGERIFMTFKMPMIVLAIRMEVEVIFKNSYPDFFNEDTQEKIAMKLINDLITQLIDPNIFYSRFSFFESGRDAIEIKYSKARSAAHESTRNKFFTRSALVSQLIPNPSEGKIRALFGTGKNAILAKTAEIQQSMPTRQQNMSHYYGSIAKAAGENTLGGSRVDSLRQSAAYPSRKLKTAGNPIGIMDMGDQIGGYNKRSLGGRTNSQYASSVQQSHQYRPGVQTAGENKRSRIKRSNMAGSSGVTASTSHKGGQYGGGFKIAQQHRAGLPPTNIAKDIASSASSLPPMQSHHSTVGHTARSFGMSNFKQQILAEMTQPPQDNEADQVLDIESKVQMFKITVDKINKTRKRKLMDTAPPANPQKQLLNNFVANV